MNFKRMPCRGAAIQAWHQFTDTATATATAAYLATVERGQGQRVDDGEVDTDCGGIAEEGGVVVASDFSAHANNSDGTREGLSLRTTTAGSPTVGKSGDNLGE